MNRLFQRLEGRQNNDTDQIQSGRLEVIMVIDDYYDNFKAARKSSDYGSRTTST